MDLDKKMECFLSKYKLETLRIERNGSWKDEKNVEHYFSWILPIEYRFRNVLQSAYEDHIISYIEGQEKRNSAFVNKDFHNLKSSQALCFNLFCPIIFTKCYECIDIEIKVDKYTYPYFELRTLIDKTQFDFYIGKGYEVKEGKYFGYIFEVKYSEKGFSTSTDLDVIEKRFNGIYKEKTNEFSSVNRITLEKFYENYQFFRNIFYSTDGTVYFIFPKFRYDLKERIEGLIKEYCTKEQSRKIKILYIEDIIERITNKYKDKNILNHYKLFKEKYIEYFKI